MESPKEPKKPDFGAISESTIVRCIGHASHCDREIGDMPAPDLPDWRQSKVQSPQKNMKKQTKMRFFEKKILEGNNLLKKSGNAGFRSETALRNAVPDRA